MKARRVPWAIAAALVLFFAAKITYDALGAARTTAEVAALESRLVHGKCIANEAIDRWLLQQSWFYDEEFTDLAGTFGQFTFGMYERGSAKQVQTEGAFCIAGSDLVVSYFKTHHVPGALEFRSFSDWTIKFGTKIERLGEDVYAVHELTKRRMVLQFSSDGREHVFYRKN